MVRTTHLPPNFVQFIVPLNINKLDLKDYLYHVYGVQCLSVRSYIEQQKIAQTKRHLGERHVEWYRPRATKRMTVELVEPFIYPEAPTEFKPYISSSLIKFLSFFLFFLWPVNTNDTFLWADGVKQLTLRGRRRIRCAEPPSARKRQQGHPRYAPRSNNRSRSSCQRQRLESSSSVTGIPSGVPS